MELLLSNYPPMKTKCRTFSDMFYSMVPKSTELDIAVGYITSPQSKGKWGTSKLQL